MKRYVDLHLHTVYSDGTKTPSELLELVRSKNLTGFSITDHDSLDGLRKMKELLTKDDPELIPGIEISTTYNDTDMHILAYGIDPDNDLLNETIRRFKHNRNNRGKKMVEKLNGLGIAITFDDVLQQADGASVGRPHVARALYEKGFVDCYEEAFARFISDRGPAFVPKENFKPKDAFDVVHQAGGLAFLAHPGIGNKEQYLDELLGFGLDGIEAYHPNHKMSDVDLYKHLAERHRLVISGGSDYHGIEGRYGNIGSQKVPYECLLKIKEKAKTN